MRARTTAGTVTAAAIVVVRVLELMVVGVDEADGINDSIEAGKELDRIPVDERFDAALDVIELNGEFDVLCAAANVVIPVAAIDNHQLSYYKSTSVNGRNTYLPVLSLASLPSGNTCQTRLVRTKLAPGRYMPSKLER
jgi:hypothetical protein